MLKRDVAPSATKLVTVVCATLTALAATTSCSGSPSQQPPSTALTAVRDYARALSDGENKAAYALMSPEYRERVSFETWQKNVADNPQEASEAARRLARVRDDADLLALQQHSSQPLQLTEQNGRFYIASEPIELYEQSTPRAALRSFIEAFTRKRYDVIMRLMPEADKEGVTTDTLARDFGHNARDDIARMLSQLVPNLNAPIEVHGDRATMPYAHHHRVQFLLEAGRWRIVEPQ
jgi:hypothetical protein